MAQTSSNAVEPFAAALAQPELLADVLNVLGEAVYLVDRTRRICFWSARCEEVSGHRARDVVGRHCFDDVLRHVDADGRSLCAGLCPLAGSMRDGRPRHELVWLHHREGHRVPVRVHVHPLRNAAGDVIGALEAFTEESAPAPSAERLAELERLALVDPLTEVPNRRELDVLLAGRLAELRRHEVPCAVAVVDIDGFKVVNDLFGHHVGDAALRMVARTLAINGRAEDEVARLGGDEFVLVLPHTDEAAALAACERLRRLVARSSLPVEAAGVSVTVSVGVTAARRCDRPETVLQRADLALLEAKQLGKDRVHAG